MLARPCPICHAASARHERDVNEIALARCGGCGFVYTGLPDRTIADANAALGSDVADYYESTQAHLDRVWFARIAARLGREGARVLDVGCGNGLLVEAFRRQRCAAEGLDPSPWALKAASERQFVLHHGFVEDDELAPGSYDIVTASSTFEHAPDPIRLARSLLRLLCPGGTLYLCGIPNYGSWAVRIGWATFRHNNPPWHASFFTPRTLRMVFDHADTRPLVERSVVRTYGIPEVHHYYSRTMRWRGQAADRADPPGDQGHDARRGAPQRMAIAAYIGLGRPFRLGDKLEATIRRSDVAWSSLRPRE